MSERIKHFLEIQNHFLQWTNISSTYLNLDNID